MALRAALSRVSHEGGLAAAAAAPLSRALHSLTGVNTAQFANQRGIDEGVPALSGVIPITGPLSAAWCERMCSLVHCDLQLSWACWRCTKPTRTSLKLYKCHDACAGVKRLRHLQYPLLLVATQFRWVLSTAIVYRCTACQSSRALQLIDMRSAAEQCLQQLLFKSYGDASCFNAKT